MATKFLADLGGAPAEARGAERRQLNGWAWPMLEQQAQFRASIAEWLRARVALLIWTSGPLPRRASVLHTGSGCELHSQAGAHA